MRRLTLLVTVFALAASACTSTTTSAPPTTPPASTASPTPTATPPPADGSAIPLSRADFGTVPSIPLLTDTPAYAGPPRPHSLDGVAISPSAKNLLTASVIATIERQGFVVIPGPDKQFHDLYGALPYGGGGTVYATADAIFHTWHLTFDKVLRSLEQDVLLPKLEGMVREVAADAAAQRAALKGTPMAAASARVDRLFQVEMALLGLATPDDPAVVAELALIGAHESTEASPISGIKMDYSVFTPRGHYTRTPELTRYFVAMTLLGQTAFPMDEGARSVDLRAAVLAARLFVPEGLGSPAVGQAWRDIYEPTAFLVGSADDYTPEELAVAVDAVKSGAMAHPAALGDADLEAMRAALVASRPVQIDTELPSMRLMGVRFVLDSWVLDQLITPNVGTVEDPRVMPSTLDLASVFGSRVADGVQRSTGQYGYENYGTQVKALRRVVAARDPKAWGGTVYDGWLWSIQPLWTPHGAAYPDTMRTRAWATKDLQTGAGSYAELKHDTILYAKQFGAEGGTEPPPYQPRNWVEPEPAAYLRLAATADLLRSGLADRHLLSKESDGLLTDLTTELRWFAGIAKDELAGRPISARDNAELEGFGGWLEQVWFRTADQTKSGASSTDEDSAIVADIGRSFDKVLEVGTGRIDTILILVPDDKGRFQLAEGAVYSFYEFTQPVSERLDDTAWRQLLDKGDQPARPTWENVLFPG